MELEELTIKRAHQGLIKKEFSVLELAQSCLKKTNIFDKKISAFLTVFEDSVITQAKEIDKKISQGEEISILAGIPVAIKDNILIKDTKCTAGSKILENYISSYDATCISKLRKLGVVFLGKTNLDEFAMGSSTENSAFKKTRNPLDLTRVPGGSSGGSAAAVAANECIFSLGSDTGGSIRQPAAFCGVVGLKPTYGAVSRYGLIAFASSLDQIGPLTKTVEDCQIVFEAIKGRDEMDSTSISAKCKVQNAKRQPKIQNFKIGVPKEYFIKGMEPEVEKLVKKAIKKYEEMGAKILEISLPHTKYALACYYIISTSEASANLARYDGIKYGKSDFLEKTQFENLLDFYLKAKEQGFGDEVKRRIMLGTYALSTGYYEAYYLQAQKVRNLIRTDFEKAFEKVDFIFTPVSPSTAFKIGEKIKDPLAMYLSDIFTISINLAGLPALSMPCGEVQGLPVGLQIIGKKFSENEIFEVAKRCLP